jgi:hypothetical protein
MRTVFLRAQIEDECVIMSLIYLERLLKVSGLILSPTTWRSIMLSSIVMASKVWDDLRCSSPSRLVCSLPPSPSPPHPHPLTLLFASHMQYVECGFLASMQVFHFTAHQ